MDIDWTLLKSFAAVGEHGTLSAAARATGTSQPTMSRHISVLEQQLGSRLFDRSVGGLALTVTGEELLRHAQEMKDAAVRLSMALDSNTETLSGSVRLTASRIVATYILPNIIKELRLAEPDIDIEMVASDRTENLSRREADIAVRMYRPTQADIFTRKLCEMPIGMFAHEAYIARRGMPEQLSDILDHDVIGYDRNMQIIDGFRQAGVNVDPDFFAFRSDDQVVCWQMVLAGLGLGFNQIHIGAAHPQIIRIETVGDIGSLPIWLSAHAELKSSPRVRRVFDFLAERLAVIG